MKTHAALVAIAVACTMLAAAAPADAQAERVEPFTHLTGPRVELGEATEGASEMRRLCPNRLDVCQKVLGVHDLLRGQVTHTALSPTVVTRIAETPATTRERHRANEYGGLQTVGQVQGRRCLMQRNTAERSLRHKSWRRSWTIPGRRGESLDTEVEHDTSAGGNGSARGLGRGHREKRN